MTPSAYPDIMRAVRSTLDIVADLMDAFPRQEVEPRTLQIYVRELSDVPQSTLGDAVTILIRTSEFFPTVRAIREAVAEISLRLPSEDEALTQVERRIRWAAADEGGDPPAVHADVRRALDHIGGYHALKTSDRPQVARGQFLRIYREIRSARIRDAEATGTGRPTIEVG